MPALPAREALSPEILEIMDNISESFSSGTFDIGDLAVLKDHIVSLQQVDVARSNLADPASVTIDIISPEAKNA